MSISENPDGVIEFYRDCISLANEENKVFQAIRECHAINKKIVDLCRSLLFLNAQDIAYYHRRIIDEKGTLAPPK